MVKRSLILFCIAVLCIFTVSGCAHRNIARRSYSASLAEIIEPVKDSVQTEEKKPLAVPASIAILVVKSSQPNNYIPNTTLRKAAENLKTQMLENPRYVKSVEIVNENDMVGKITFEKIRQIYNADVVVIVSYQQDQRSSQSGAAGLADAAIFGIFLVPGVEIKTHTVIDGKVIHIASNAMIFRATGSDEKKSLSTSYAEQGSYADESIKGILAATTSFGNSLSKVLAKFDNYDVSQAVAMSAFIANDAAPAFSDKSANDYWEKVNTYKSSGGGAIGLAPILISAALFYAIRRRK